MAPLRFCHQKNLFQLMLPVASKDLSNLFPFNSY